MRSYTWDASLEIAKRASKDIEAWLRSRPETTSVRNVEDDVLYQSRDIDLVWKITSAEVNIEIKGDSYRNSKNFFFETISNKQKGTPGCFLYTEADELFYYFVNKRELYILPMPATRDWFKPRMQEFFEATTATRFTQGIAYNTVGRLVGIEQLMKSVPSCRKERI